MNLFDTSAIINLFGEKKLEKLLEGWTLNLALYELGNAVWKQACIYRTITPNEANAILDPLTEIFTKLKKPKKENTLETLKIAIKEKITFYDASYIQAALENNLILVTDDKQLYQKSKKYTKTITSNELKTATNQQAKTDCTADNF